MLKRIEISDYRSCVAAKLNLQPDLSILIGPNGSGKTNILSACLLLRTLATARPPLIEREEPADFRSKLAATFRIDRKDAKLTAHLDLRTDADNCEEIVASKQSWHAPDFTGNRRRPNTPLCLGRRDAPHRYFYYLEGSRLQPRSIEQDLGQFGDGFFKIARFCENIKYYSATQFTNPALCPTSFEIEKDGNRQRSMRAAGGHGRFLHDLYRERDSESYGEFFSIIGPDGIGLVDAIAFKEIAVSSVQYTVHSGGRVHQRKRDKALIIPQFSIGPNTLSPNQLSEGTFKTITLLFYLITDQSSALLIEEPEVCVHHGLLASIVSLIKDYSTKKQIVMSTHSDFVLDQVTPRQVYKITRDNESGSTASPITKAMSAKELNALRDYLEREGNLGEYWRHGGLD